MDFGRLVSIRTGKSTAKCPRQYVYIFDVEQRTSQLIRLFFSMADVHCFAIRSSPELWANLGDSLGFMLDFNAKKLPGNSKILASRSVF